MNRIKCLVSQYNCHNCGKAESFTDSINCNIRKAECNDFVLLFIRIKDGCNFKLKITFCCKNCWIPKIFELKIGKINSLGSLITDDTFNHNCCGNMIEVISFLSEEYINENNPDGDMLIGYNNDMNNHINNNLLENNNANNQNNINSINIQNNSNNQINNNPQIENKNNELENLNSINVIEFNEKNKLVNFIDEQTKKNYKIYIKSDLKLKFILEDLGSQFPEINYKNKKIFINGNEVNPEMKFNNCNLNDNSSIILK